MAIEMCGSTYVSMIVEESDLRRILPDKEGSIRTSKGKADPSPIAGWSSGGFSPKVC